jgi:hypothetical protein
MKAPLLALSALLFCAGSAQAGSPVSQAVKDACRGDYKAYCSQHEVGSQALRDCMSDAFDKLSEPCVSAIMDAEMERRQAQQDEAQPAKRKRQVVERKRKKHWIEHVKHGEQVAQRFMSRVAMKVNRFLR